MKKPEITRAALVSRALYAKKPLVGAGAGNWVGGMASNLPDAGAGLLGGMKMYTSTAPVGATYTKADTLT